MNLPISKENPIENPLLKEILHGLYSQPKTLSSKFFYDKRGSELFEQICTLEEYYPTRTEILILKTYVSEISSALGRNPILYEFGSGSSLKIQILLSGLPKITGYVPIDICPDSLTSGVERLKKRFPDLAIAPICADFSKKIRLTDEITRNHPEAIRVAFFPGSTIGNFTPKDAMDFLSNAAFTLGSSGKLLIGVDRVKESSVLERAYNDARGVTRDFNLNVLNRLNHEFGADFDISCFLHQAFYNRELKRIEMHLKCVKSCRVNIQGYLIDFRVGETIHTENSYKYSPESFIALAEKSNFRFLKSWSDSQDYFTVFLFAAHS